MRAFSVRLYWHSVSIIYSTHSRSPFPLYLSLTVATMAYWIRVKRLTGCFVSYVPLLAATRVLNSFSAGGPAARRDNSNRPRFLLQVMWSFLRRHIDEVAPCARLRATRKALSRGQYRSNSIVSLSENCPVMLAVLLFSFKY